MPLRSSLARSLQYAMANMADIKTPLCALQPTPAIPHTASRSGAGTRGGGSAGSSGRRHGARVPPTPGARRPRCPRPAARGPRPPRDRRRSGRVGPGRLGARTPAANSQGRLSPSALAHFLKPAPSQRCLLTGGGAEKLSAPARWLSERPCPENCWAALLPGVGGLGHLSPPPAASRRGRGCAGPHGRWLRG